MSIIKHEFTKKLLAKLEKRHPKLSETILERSHLVQYINIKTRSATKGSKSRSSFANHYALYVLVEDYVKGSFDTRGKYSDYKGAQFVDLFRRQRELPFGKKLQNHALNHRLNEEFKKYFPNIEQVPIIRDVDTNRYWINEKLLKVKISGKDINIAKAVIEIIDEYVVTKRESFDKFIEDCRTLGKITKAEPKKAIAFIQDLIRPNVDARIFEIVSYAILKEVYSSQSVFWGYSKQSVKQERLRLFKTGRTNANDGGIDFVLKPLGRFFQVTETVDVKKYFLDIEKVERYPMTFVIKSEIDVKSLKKSIREQAQALYEIDAVVTKYMNCIEEIVNIPAMRIHLEQLRKENKLDRVINEIVRQSVVEFNYDEE